MRHEAANRSPPEGPFRDELRIELVRLVRDVLRAEPARARAQELTRAWLQDVWERRAMREDFDQRREEYARRMRHEYFVPPPDWTFEISDIRAIGRSDIASWFPPELSLANCPDQSLPLPLPKRALRVEEKYAIVLAIHKSAATVTTNLCPAPGAQPVTIQRWLTTLPDELCVSPTADERRSNLRPFLEGCEAKPFEDLAQRAKQLPRDSQEAETLRELIREVEDDQRKFVAMPGEPEEQADEDRTDRAGDMTRNRSSDSTGIDDSHLSTAQLAAKFGVPAPALRCALDRWRRKNPKGWIENTERGPREGKYLYRVGAVRPLIDAQQTRSERASKKI